MAAPPPPPPPAPPAAAAGAPVGPPAPPAAPAAPPPPASVSGAQQQQQQQQQQQAKKQPGGLAAVLAARRAAGADAAAEANPTARLPAAALRVIGAGGGGGGGGGGDGGGRGVWACGYGVYGRLAQGDEVSHGGFVRARHWGGAGPRPAGAAVAGVTGVAALGAAHCALVADDGRSVYTWGKCHYGQLGHGQIAADRYVPWRVAAFDAEAEEEEGDTDGADDDAGKLDAESEAAVAEMMSSATLAATVAPRGGLLSPTARLTGLMAGDSFVFAWADDGSVWSWGCGFQGALGHGGEAHELRPRLVESLREEGRRIVAGDGGAFHSILLTDDGTALAVGHNEYGQCGRAVSPGGGHNLSRFTPLRLDDDVDGSDRGPDTQWRATAVATGRSHTLIVAVPRDPDAAAAAAVAAVDADDEARAGSARVFSCGDNEYRQLGRDLPSGTAFDRVPTPVTEGALSPASLEKKGDGPIAVAGGTGSSIVLTHRGRVIRFGWKTLAPTKTRLRGAGGKPRATAIVSGQQAFAAIDQDGHLYVAHLRDGDPPLCGGHNTLHLAPGVAARFRSVVVGSNSVMAVER